VLGWKPFQKERMDNNYYEKRISYHFRPSTYNHICFEIEKIEDRNTKSCVLISTYYCRNEKQEEIYIFDNELKRWKGESNYPVFDDALSIKGITDLVLNYLNDHGTPFDDVILQARKELILNE
jgi:hypothetical protein